MNSAVIGVLVGLAVSRLAPSGLSWATVAGGAAFVVAGWLHLRQEYSMFAALPGVHVGSDPIVSSPVDVVVGPPRG